MRVLFGADHALAFDDYGRVGKIEGFMFKMFLNEIVHRKSRSKKTEQAIVREVAPLWVTEWKEPKEANK